MASERYGPGDRSGAGGAGMVVATVMAMACHGRGGEVKRRPGPRTRRCLPPCVLGAGSQRVASGQPAGQPPPLQHRPSAMIPAASIAIASRAAGSRLHHQHAHRAGEQAPSGALSNKTYATHCARTPTRLSK